MPDRKSNFTPNEIGRVAETLRRIGYRFVAIEVGIDAITFFLDSDRTREEMAKLDVDAYFKNRP